MKKKYLFILLLIISFVTIGSVNAAADASMIVPLTMGESITIPTGASSFPVYSSHKFSVKVGGVDYPAFCINPGKGVPKNVACTLMNPDDLPMTYMAAKGGVQNLDKNTADFTFRTLGIMDNADLIFSRTGVVTGSSNRTAQFITIQWHKYLVGENTAAGPVHPSLNTYIATSPELIGIIQGTAKQYYQYRRGYGSVPAPDSPTGEGVNVASGLTGKYFTLTKVGESNDMTTYRVSMTSPYVSASDVTFTAVGGVTIVNYSWNVNQGMVVVKASTAECSGYVQISGKVAGASSEETSIYFCKNAGGGNRELQQYVAIMPGLNSDQIPVSPKCKECEENNDSKEEEYGTCDDKIDTNYVQGDEINTCCTNQHSYLEEYTIGQLFCDTYNEKIGTSWWTNKCYNSKYKNQILNEQLKVGLTESKVHILDYCYILCTERIDITVPKQIASATGKFFKLAEMEVSDPDNGTYTTRAPFIKGAKRCTMKMNYKRERYDYESTIASEIANFNDYQQKIAYCHLTAYKYHYSTETVTNTQTPSVVKLQRPYSVCDAEDSSLTAKGSSYHTKSTSEGDCGASVTCNDEKGCQGYHTQTHYEYDNNVAVAKCYTKYRVYELTATATGISCSDGTCSMPYYGVKVNDDFYQLKDHYDNPAVDKYDGLTVETDGKKGTVSHKKITKTSLDEDTCDDAVATAKASKGTGWECQSDCGGSYRDYTTTDDAYDTEDDMPKTHKDACKEADGTNDGTGGTGGARGKFLDDFDKAKELEKLTEKCQTFFTDTGDGSKIADNPDLYDIQPKTVFNYMHVWLKGSNERKIDWQHIDFGDATCVKSYEHKDDDGDVDGTDELSSTVFGEGSEIMKDLKRDAARMTSESDFGFDESSTYTKFVRMDSLYEAYCHWDDPLENDGEITLYPGPQFGVSVGAAGVGTNESGHKYQYALYLTQFSGQFETYWNIQGLGSSQTKAKFTRAFNEQGETCAEKGEGYSDTTPEDSRNDNNGIFTCKLDIVDGGMRIGFCPPDIDETGGGLCDKNVRDVYEFRVVDPKDLFPGNSSNWTDVATNWKNEAGSWGVTYGKIRDVANQNKTYHPDYLTYSFKLEPRSIKIIKDYNNDHKYVDYENSGLTCHGCNSSIDEEDCGTIDPSGSCYNSGRFKYSCSKCYSNFLDDLEDEIVGTKTLPKEVWNRTDSLDYVRNHNDHIHWSK